MNLTKHIPESVTRRVGLLGLKVSAKSPTLLFAAGTVGVLAGTVLACRATLRVSKQLDTFKQEVYDVKVQSQGDEGKYSKELIYVYTKNTWLITKEFAPAIFVGGLGVVCLTSSHVILQNRNQSLMAAYAAVHTAFENYRARVREEIGEERERELYHAVETVQFTDDEGRTGELKVADPSKWSPYARFFDEGSPHWQPQGELNRLWIECQQTYLNNLLRARGFVFLNEAYEALGIPWSSAGQAVGWLMNGDGDNYIDFGLYKAHSRDFINGREPNILLEFNVDGVIIDKI